MKRRTGLQFIGSAFATAWTPVWPAKPAQRRPLRRVGILSATWEDDNPYFVKPLLGLGYERGRDIEFVYRRADGLELLEAHARELTAMPVDLIAASSMLETIAARKATDKVPIVMLYGVAPVELGVVQSLARPGGNVTGTLALPLELADKAIGLLHEAVPRLRRLVLLLDTDPWALFYRQRVERAAAALGLSIQSFEIASVADRNRVLDVLQRDRPDALMVMPGLAPHTEAILERCHRQRLPAMWGTTPAVRAGGLMAYAPHMNHVYARSAGIADRVLRGTMPADIPVEQPTHYVLTINRSAARRIGFTFPQRLLLRADRVLP